MTIHKGPIIYSKNMIKCASRKTLTSSDLAPLSGMEAVFEKLAQIEATTAFNLILTIKCRGRAKLYLGLRDPASGRIIENGERIYQNDGIDQIIKDAYLNHNN